MQDCNLGWEGGVGIAWRRPAVLASLAAALVACGSARAAEAQLSTERAAVARGLETQFEVALIRERKLADDRESEMLAALEQRLARARSEAAAARGDAKAARAELVAARADYARLADEVAERHGGDDVEASAIRRQAETEATAASPEKLAALQAFADGDRTGAWTRLKALADADAGAAPAARAAGLRELARLRDVMRVHGEATAADVLALWDQAVALDPANFTAETERARLAHATGDLARARAAAERAVALAFDPPHRAYALRLVGEQATDQHDWPAAAEAYARAIDILHKSAADEATERSRANLAFALDDLGQFQIHTGDYDGARKSLAEALDVRVKVVSDFPADALAKGYLANSYLRIGDLAADVGDLKAARAAFDAGLALRRAQLEADPTNLDLQYYASAFYRREGEVALKSGDTKGARGAFETCVAIRRRLSAADPSSADLAVALSFDLENLGEALWTLGDGEGARADYAESYAIRSRLAAADPSSAMFEQYVLRALVRLARTPGTGKSWQDVADQYRKIKTEGHLVPNDERVLEGLRARGLANGL